MSKMVSTVMFVVEKSLKHPGVRVVGEGLNLST